MSLEKFTISDRRKIQLALDLPGYQLDDDSQLYDCLHYLEESDRENGIDRSGCVKRLASEINTIDEKIDGIFLNDPDYGVASLTETIKDETRRSVTYDTSRRGGADSGLRQLKSKKQIELRLELNWKYDNRICLG